MPKRLSQRQKQTPSRRDRKIYQRLAIEGHTREEVAAEFQRRPETIRLILLRVERWLASQHGSPALDQVVRQHLERLEHQWRELMEAWYRSKETDEITKVSTDGQGRKKAEQTRKPQTGDVRYLDQARRILSEIRTLCGVGRTGVHMQGDDDVQSLTIEQREAALDRLLETLGQRARETPVVGTDYGSETDGDRNDAA